MNGITENQYIKKNDDGSYKLKAGKEGNLIKIPAKELIKNQKQDAPTVTHNETKKEISITPNSLDTDAKTITIKYTPEGATEEATVIATKGNDGTWTALKGFTVTVDEKTSAI